MKLKMESQENVTVLVVTEAIEPSHLPILKAGLTKLIQSGKKAILLDFTSVGEKDFKEPSLLQQISELRGWAAAMDAQVAVISANPKLGHAAQRVEGVQLVTSQIAQLLALEARLQAQLRTLEQRKADLEKKLGAAGAADDLKKVQQQNSLLKKNITAAEKISRRYLKLRSKEQQAKLPAQQATQENLIKLMEQFLKQEGVLK
jgi:hypothetical protein